MTTDQKFIPRFKFALYFFAQIPIRQLEVLTQISIILQQGKVAFGNANQLCKRKDRKAILFQNTTEYHI